ncbi:MAG TPA: T9SS type A sorting domain-containing protein [Flavobacterium sp.]|nr:T9SS type A sorting domain-containing protein [Flavobacterium sp.]
MKKITMAFFMLCSTFLFAQDGVLDTSFGTNGYVIVNGASFGKSSLQADGKIIYLQSNKFRRLNANGTPDTTFGVAGAITVVQPGIYYDSFTVANNQITLITKALYDIYTMGRYNFDGTVDATLGTAGAGYLTIDLGDDIQAHVVSKALADNRLYIAGSSDTAFGSYDDFYAKRFNADGTVDSNFNNFANNLGINIGYTSIGYPTDEYLSDIDLKSTGSVIISGVSAFHESTSTQTSYYKATFALISSINNAQPIKVQQNYQSYGAAKSDIGIDQDDNIYLLGGQMYIGSVATPVNVIQKFNASGQQVNSFGNSSVLTVSLTIDATTQADFRKIMIQPDGKILLAGMTAKTNALVDYTALILARYLPDGTLDATFGTNGYVLHDIAHPNTTANHNELTEMSASADYSSIYISGHNQENAIVLKFGNISMTPLVAPEFTPIAPICSGQTLADLPTTSNNAVTGTWAPAISNTATTEYTFTPAAGAHASVTTMTITVNQPTASTLAAEACDSYTLNGTTYTSSGTYTQVSTNALGCDHTTTLNLTIENAVPITGQSTQTLVVGATIADIIVSPSTVVWYASAADAAGQNNPLSATTALVNSATYYAVSSSALGCISTPFPVTVSVTLGNVAFDDTAFSLYPNPSSDFITVGYSQSIDKVSFINMLGQEVLAKSLNSNTGKIDVSALPSGTYFVKAYSGNLAKTLKLVKN